MDKETAKAINNVSKRLNEMERKIDNFFNGRIDGNKKLIEENEQASLDSADALEEMNNAIMDISDMLAEMEIE